MRSILLAVVVIISMTFVSSAQAGECQKCRRPVLRVATAPARLAIAAVKHHRNNHCYHRLRILRRRCCN